MASKAYHLVVEAGYGTKYEQYHDDCKIINTKRMLCSEGWRIQEWGLWIGEEGLPVEMCFKTGVKGDSRLNW